MHVAPRWVTESDSFTGAAFFAEVYPALKGTVLTWGDLGKLTIPDALGINHWIVIAVFAVGGIMLFRWFEKRGL